jgi:histidyl-tRNA synthetase
MSSVMNVERVRGTRDFLPKDWRVMQYVFTSWRRVCERYGFEEFEMPVLENYKMYVDKSGEELTKQVYNFKDKGGRELALRPETTPSLIRIYEANKYSLIKPVKWYCIPRCFRYEKPQKGRLREFFQLNVDIIEGGKEADGEVLACAVDLMREFGLNKKDFKILVSNRKLFEGVVKSITDADVLPVVDKFKKVKKEEFLRLLMRKGLGKKQANQVYRLARIRGKPSKTLKELKDYCSNSEALEGWKELDGAMKALAAYGLLDYCEIDLSVVRGLAYYTGLVFECFDTKERLRSVLGGGAYKAGKRDAVGFAAGDTVLLELLKKKKLIPELDKKLDFYVAIVNDSVRDKSKAVIDVLRDAGYNVDFDLMGRSLRKQLDYARRVGVDRVVIVGGKELEKNCVRVKEFGVGGERVVKINELVR